MSLIFSGFAVIMSHLARSRAHGGLLEAVKDDVRRQGCGVRHVGSEETVVAQLVEDYLVGREISDW